MSDAISDERGWQCGRSRDECHKYMLENKLYTDVSLKFRSNLLVQQLEAHKYILVSMSPVFEAMLTSDFQESDGVVNIDDIKVDVFKEVLNYMYHGYVAFTGENVMHIHYAAKKYLLDGLVAECLDFIENKMSVDNVCTILDLCLSYDENQIKQKCVSFWEAHTSGVIESDDFLGVSQAGLKQLLSTDNQCSADEFVIAEACVKWAKYKIANSNSKDQTTSDTQSGIHAVGDDWTPTEEEDKTPINTIFHDADDLHEDILPVSGEILSSNGKEDASTPSLDSEDASDEGIRAVLGECLYLIRFFQMTGRGLSAFSESYPNLLTPHEQLCLMRYLQGPHSIRIKAVHSMGFRTQERIDKKRRQATIKLQVDNVKDIPEYVWSAPSCIRNVFWRIYAIRVNKVDGDTLGVYLYRPKHNGGTGLDATWSVSARATFRLLGQLHKMEEPLQHAFEAGKGFGFDSFITFKELLDPTNKYVQDGGITLEADITVVHVKQKSESDQ